MWLKEMISGQEEFKINVKSGRELISLLNQKGRLVRSSHWKCSIKKAVFKHFTIFTGKNLCCSLFLRPATLLKKRLKHMCFPTNTVKFLITPILKNTCKRLLSTSGFFSSTLRKVATLIYIVSDLSCCDTWYFQNSLAIS